MAQFQDQKRQILERVDILQVVSDHVALKRKGRRYVGLCCFHSEKTPSFTVNPDLGIFKCFGCGKAGDMFRFVELRENVPFIEALRILADRAGVELRTRQTPAGPNEPTRADLAALNVWAAGLFRAQLLHEVVGASTRQYLATRNISSVTCERFGLGLAPGTGPTLAERAAKAGYAPALLLACDLRRAGDNGPYDTFRDRLMFPIREVTGRVAGFGGRTLADHPSKYVNTRQTELFDKGRLLYGLDQARDAISQRGRAIVVEGYTDCLALHQAGYSETVATMGTALTDHHVELLRRYCDDVIILFDSDQAGQTAADRALMIALPRGLKVRLTRIPDGKDPGDYFVSHSPEAFLDVLKHSVDALEFRWSATLTRFQGGTSATAQREAVVDFLSAVAGAVEGGSVDAIHRGLLINQVAHLLRMDRNEVSRLISRRRVSKPSGAAAVSSAPRTVSLPNPEQVAWRHLMGALLNEPALMSTMTPLPDRSRISDALDTQVFDLLIELCGHLGDFRLADVLAACEDPALADRVTELAVEGERRGDVQATLRSALQRIERGSFDSTLELSKQRLRSMEREADDQVREDLQAVDHGLRTHRHFAPRRLIRQASATTDPAEVPTASKPNSE